MPYFIINGKPDCPNFAHALYVAQYLSERLPNFFYKKVEMTSDEWPLHVTHLNRSQNWYMTDSPIIWKEINRWGGKKYLLGGLSEFWEYVYCYYGLESLIPKCELKELADDNSKFYKFKLNTSRSKAYTYIGIIGASNPLAALLIHELLNLKCLRKIDGIAFKIFDNYQEVDEKAFNFISDLALNFNQMYHYGNTHLIEVCESMMKAITNCDIIFNLEQLSYISEDGTLNFSLYNYRINMFSECIISGANSDAKIILVNEGPVCYLGSMLIESCGKKFPNIVAVTQDKGFPYLNAVSECTGIPLDRLCAPAVWGSVGLNSFVDVRNMLYKADVYRPYQCSLLSHKGSTLPLGVVSPEIRLLSCALKDVSTIKREAESKTRELQEQLGRESIFSKCRAVISLMKLWYSQDAGDEIISLGVVSDGSFDIPEGMFFSQPVKLNSRKKWVPYKNYPLLDKPTRRNIRQCVVATKQVLKERRLWPEDSPSLATISDSDIYEVCVQEGEGEEEEEANLYTLPD